jgi:hypothetical protein
VPGDAFPVPAAGRPRQVRGQVDQGRVEQPEQGAERLGLAAVRCRGEQQQVPVGVGGQPGQQGVPLLGAAGGAALGGADAGVRLVDDDQARAGADELVPAPGGLDEVGGHHRVGVPLEQRLAGGQVAFQPAGGGGQYELGVEGELVGQLPLPLRRQRRAAHDGEPVRAALREQFGHHEACLDRLADADRVGDQQPDGRHPQREQQRHELVGARGDGELGQAAERAAAGPEAEP